MRVSWRYAGILLASAAAVALLAWLSAHPVMVIVSALVLYLAWQLVNVWRLYRRLQHTSDKTPQSLGIWSGIFELISSLELENTKQKTQYDDAIEEFQSLTDAFPDAVLVIDQKNDITWVNIAARTLLGLRLPEDLHLPVTNVLRDPDFADWLAVQSEVQSTFEMPSPRDDNIWLNASAVPYRENQRLVIFRDISDIHNVDRVRRDFVANISHELRTPLTVLVGYLEMLQDRELGDNNGAMDRMYAQALQMQSMLDDLLELSRLESRESVHLDQNVDVPAILQRLRRQAEEISGGRHNLEFQVDTSLHLLGITQDIESACRNLITNALHYTPRDGSVQIVWKESEDGAVLSVRDSGIGVPKRAIPRLTERFYRVGPDRARNTGGTGLGLSIVKHVLRAHQARLLISSDLGVGSEFVCHFPAERVLKNAALLQESPPEGAALPARSN